MQIDRTPVTSSVIAGVTYDPRTNTLEVEFHTGRVYQYFDVPPTEYDALRQADSVGRYFNRAIRNRYRSREVTERRVGPPA
jgi:hypothetical protein